MRFNLVDNKSLTHKDIATAVSWGSGGEVFTCGDDHKLMKWKVESEEGNVVVDFGENFYPTDMQWMPRQSDGGGVRRSGVIGADLLAVGTAEGKVWLLGRTGRVEKSVDAHSGAVLCVKWSWDGNAFVTAGEDGVVKIWSKGGMMRSNLAQNPVPVYGVAWSPHSDQILHSNGKQLVIRSIQASVKPNSWKAHDSVILCVDWCPVTNMILSGAEDCRYKVWTVHGTPVYSGAAHDYPVTSVSWSPDGSLFVVGSFDSLRLCDKNGWSHSLEKTRGYGSVLRTAWSPDGTQLAGICGSGRLLLGHLSGMSVSSHVDDYVATMIDDRHVQVNALSHSGADELLEFRDRVIKLSFRYGHLIAATPSSCYIYSTKNWNTPVVIELKESRLSLIEQSEKSVLLIDGTSLLIYSYEGRLMCAPKIPPSISPELLSNSSCCLATDTVALLDLNNNHVYIIDTGTPAGRYISGPSTTSHQAMSASTQTGTPAIIHTTTIMEIGLEVTGKYLALLDSNRDLIIFPTRGLRAMIRGKSANQNSAGVKLAGLIGNFKWHDNTPSLCALQAGSNQILIWPLPSLGLRDRVLVNRSAFELTCSVHTSSSQEVSLHQFVGSSIIIRRQDGALISCFVPSCIEVFHKMIQADKFKDAIALCRLMDAEYLWCCLAYIALSKKDVNTAKIAYAALNDIDRVEYLETIQALPKAEAQQADLLIMEGAIGDAETVLVQAGLLPRAVWIHLHLYDWERALDLVNNSPASSYKPLLLDLVLSMRKQFLDNRKETNPAFIKFKDKSLPEWEEMQQVLMKLEKCQDILA